LVTGRFPLGTQDGKKGKRIHGTPTGTTARGNPGGKERKKTNVSIRGPPPKTLKADGSGVTVGTRSGCKKKKIHRTSRKISSQLKNRAPSNGGKRINQETKSTTSTAKKVTHKSGNQPLLQRDKHLHPTNGVVVPKGGESPTIRFTCTGREVYGT